MKEATMNTSAGGQSQKAVLRFLFANEINGPNAENGSVPRADDFGCAIIGMSAGGSADMLFDKREV